MDRKKALGVVREVALDSVPPLRRRAYAFIEDNDNAETADVATSLGLPTTTTRRILEDLAAHGLIARHSQGQGKADRWKRTAWAAEAD
jgi:predicted ArsR family transcriptional regulator